MARIYCRILGIATLLMGVAGFMVPHLLGFHLTPIHNVIHLATGAIASWLGFGGSYDACRNFCKAFGVVYGLVALLGFVAPGLLSTILGHPPLTAAELMPDNLLHVAVTGSAFFAGFSRSQEHQARTA